MSAYRSDVATEFGWRRLLANLRRSYRLELRDDEEQRWVWLDTFDRRLYRKSLVLLFGEGRLSLRGLGDWTELQDARAEQQPRFARDLPPGGLKTAVASILQVRALLELGELRSRSFPISIFDLQGRNISRLDYDRIWLGNHPDRPPELSYLSLQPAPGCGRETAAVAARLQDLGFQPGASAPSGIDVSDLAPASYSTKPAVRLAPEMRPEEILPALLRHYLVGVIQVNEEGIKQDIDTEFLHDFRVASRRTRSILRELKDVFPQGMIKPYRRRLAVLGKQTNELRDLDVYLLEADRYRSQVSPDLAPDLEPVFAHLRRKREGVLRQVVLFLESAEYREIVGEWDAFLDRQAPAAIRQTIGEETLMELACRKIRKKHGAVLKLGNKVHAGSDDAAYHRLRIASKQLRYLMEFFSSLFGGEIEEPVRRLKSLQDRLGSIQDLAVQAETLIRLASEIEVEEPARTRTLLAVGALVSELRRRKEAARSSVLKAFRRFSSPSAQDAFHAMLRRGGEDCG